MTTVTNPLYFDTAATTPIAPEVLEAMVGQLNNPTSFANFPSRCFPARGAYRRGHPTYAGVGAPVKLNRKLTMFGRHETFYDEFEFKIERA